MKRLFGLLMVFMTLLMVSCAEQITDGTIYDKHVKAETVKFEERSKKVYRDESYTDTEYYNDSNGKRRSRTVTKTRRVFSHHKYAVYEIRNGKDYIINIQKRSEKKDGEMLKRKIYLTKRSYDKIKVGDYYTYDKSSDDSFHDNNNKTTKVSNWSRWGHDLRDYKNKP